jgi:hypothetical protein
MLTIFVLSLQLLFALFFLFMCIALLTGAPFVPSKNKSAKKMIEMAQISSSDIIYDLGSGDGRLLLMSAQYHPKKIVGLEINMLLVVFTKLRILFSPLRSRIYCKWRNFWSTPLHDATVVFVYLLPWKMQALSEKLKHELKPGTRIISNSFIFPDLKLIRQDMETNIYEFHI